MTRPAPVAITGIGCLCGAGGTLDRCMESLHAGRRAPRPPSLIAAEHPERYPVFEVGEEDLSPVPAGAPELSRTARLALEAADQALRDAGLAPEDLAGRRVGVVVGTTVGSAMNNEAFYRAYRRDEGPGLGSIRRFLRSNPAAAVAGRYGFDGPCQTVVNACSSGTDAIGLGASWIRAGLCDLVLAGGADELCRVTYNGFASLMITDPGPVRPFDRGRRGLNLGEGAAMLVLEAAASGGAAQKTNRGLVLGYGSACDAYHLTAPRPDGAGLKAAIAAALVEAGRGPEEVAFVNAHGTGTPDNDRVESRVLDEVFPGVPFLSTKGCTGHTLGAAGAIEAAFTAASLQAGRVPASAGFAEPDPELPATPLREELEIGGNVALSQSLAFGGNNAVLLIGRGR
ncbi:MAG: beta-ketoacyl-[acyl-carrier-protein] synthase family protein [Desulfuromonas sp.]|uniref:beta-ketoacyl-[acyl-carrier-protein] synthase family protein n=1 Tax=Desulfuromonas sp. TaxID=892 RepID=UPI000CAA9F6D|nr:beta-ketoacyl-[acyl-carrier-protein] synthase family protein [Desulfuromonas sp.]PLX85235.1 MAG: beta-ketoacyl-[acyl-carrier-protein] synthase family protein [Desulfuromonas sp.]